MAAVDPGGGGSREGDEGRDDKDGKDRRTRWDEEPEEKRDGSRKGGKRPGRKGKGKSVKVFVDDAGNTVLSKASVKSRTASSSDSEPERASGRRVYGKSGVKYCWCCGDYRDHVAHQCPNNFCNKCSKRGHWARECPFDPCGWCDSLDHTMEDCPERTGVKRPRTQPESGASTSAAASVAKPTAVATGGKAISYSGAVVGRRSAVNKQPPKALPVAAKVDSFLDSVSSGTSQQVVDERRASFARRKEEAKRQYEQTMARIAREEEAFEEEMQDEEETLAAIRQLRASLEERRRKRARTVDSGTPAPKPVPEELSQSTQEPVSKAPPAETTVSAEAPQPAVGEEPLVVHQQAEQVGQDPQDKVPQDNLDIGSCSDATSLFVDSMADLQLVGDTQSMEETGGDEGLLDESDQEAEDPGSGSGGGDGGGPSGGGSRPGNGNLE